jgi:hypothetical protein
MDLSEDALALAERLIHETEGRIARQVVFVEEMGRNNHPDAAAMGREILATLQTSLGPLRHPLRMRRKAHGARG